MTLASYYGYYSNIFEGDTFKFYEGNRLIGKGEITKILNEKLRNPYSTAESEALSKRLESAIEMAIEHKILSVQNSLIGFNESGRLKITGFSKWSNLESITKQRALAEIEELKDTYAHWLGLTTKFRELNSWLRPEYELTFLDGKNRIPICKVHEGRIDWMLD